MNYQGLGSKNKRNEAGAREIGAAFLLLVVLIITGYLFRNPLSDAFYSMKRVLLLKSEPAVIPTASNAMSEALQIDNDALKDLLGRAPENEKLTLAAILARPPQSPYDSLVIDIGTNNGAHIGDVVYAQSTFAIGKIVKTDAKNSVVTLFSSSGQKQSVLIGSSTTAVEAEGRGGGNFYIKIPRNIHVVAGDPIMWPDLRSVLLGVVDVVDAGEGDAYAHIYFKSPVNIQTLRYVELKANTN